MALLGAGGGMGEDLSGGGEGVGEAVVAVDAGDLFYEVDFAGEVEAPGGELDVEGVVACGSEGAAERFEVLLDEGGGDSLRREGSAEQALDSGDAERDGRALG